MTPLGRKACLLPGSSSCQDAEHLGARSAAHVRVRDSVASGGTFWKAGSCNSREHSGVGGGHAGAGACVSVLVQDLKSPRGCEDDINKTKGVTVVQKMQAGLCTRWSTRSSEGLTRCRPLGSRCLLFPPQPGTDGPAGKRGSTSLPATPPWLLAFGCALFESRGAGPADRDLRDDGPAGLW